MPEIINFVARWLGTELVNDMADRVAGRSRLAVWQRVMHRLPTLGGTEGRGYLRARAAAIIQQETDRLSEQEGAKVARLRSQIAEAALSLLIQMIAAQLERQRLQAGERRAA
jgi:hypothetical protein